MGFWGFKKFWFGMRRGHVIAKYPSAKQKSPTNDFAQIKIRSDKHTGLHNTTLLFFAPSTPHTFTSPPNTSHASYLLSSPCRKTSNSTCDTTPATTDASVMSSWVGFHPNIPSIDDRSINRSFTHTFPFHRVRLSSSRRSQRNGPLCQQFQLPQ